MNVYYLASALEFQFLLIKLNTQMLKLVCKLEHSLRVVNGALKTLNKCQAYSAIVLIGTTSITLPGDMKI